MAMSEGLIFIKTLLYAEAIKITVKYSNNTFAHFTHFYPNIRTCLKEYYLIFN